MNRKIKTGKYTKMRKRMIAGGVLALGLALTGAGVTYAASTTTGPNPMSSLVSAIATKFNLNVADVQAVVDEQMATQHATMEKEQAQRMTDRLNQAVASGKLTQAQADLIVAKKAELDANRDANHAKMEAMTDAERKAAMKTEMDALTKWATDNNIPKEFAMFGGVMMKVGHPGMGSKGGMHGDMMFKTEIKN